MAHKWADIKRRTKFRQAPCHVNPRTGQPFRSHKWAIKQGVRLYQEGSEQPYYHVYCERCGYNDPNPPRA